MKRLTAGETDIVDVKEECHMASNYERNKESIRRYQKKSTSRVVINLRNEDKAEWERIAEASGIPLATLIRKLITEYALANHIE